jgi:uncharacterized protein YfaS (alpha-2-macroglobulin family)
MVTIMVVSRSSGNPLKGKRVSLGVTMGVTSSEWTDDKGEAHFDVKPGNAEVFVDGSTEYKGHVSGRVVMYV